VAPVKRRQIVPDPQDPNVLLLRDAISHEPVKNQFVIDPMSKLKGQDMRATEVLGQYAREAEQKLKNGVKQTPLLVSGPIKVGSGCSSMACPTQHAHPHCCAPTQDCCSTALAVNSACSSTTVHNSGCCDMLLCCCSSSRKRW
jgi:hypothetical protein